MLNGMALDKTVDDLALRYLVTCEAIALQTKQIISEMNKNGHDIRSIFMSGASHSQRDPVPQLIRLQAVW